jgi:hypothetical protein
MKTIALKLYIDEWENEALLELAARREWSRQHIIRHAIREFIASAIPPARGAKRPTNQKRR